MEEARNGRKARKEAVTEEKREGENCRDREGELWRRLVERRNRWRRKLGLGLTLEENEGLRNRKGEEKRTQGQLVDVDGKLYNWIGEFQEKLTDFVVGFTDSPTLN